ncbi:MFS transporter [Sneathiella limimaris]|uniref:MFS transporter n=1 Tax=Sneathiella limimaris TaxID=1964213 RepID=UPI00146E7EE2|nr:MFS transporter [Sneathiella limimaris]
MTEALKSCWPLLLGIGLMMLGNGLQGSLLGVRASIEGFPTAITGLIMSAYYMGFLFGSIITPKILASVGHVRVFAALASLASTAALIHAVFADPYVWGVFRLLTGFSFAGLYIVSESWLNDTATNETRGSILSIYMVITFGGMAGGQILLNSYDPASFQLFVIVSVLVSLALIPSALSASPMPNMEAPDNLGIRQLYAISPLGVVSALVVGIAHGGFYSMAAVYGSLIGLSVGQISIFISAAVVGGALLQMPIGRLSDFMDRRKVLLMTAAVSLALCLVLLELQTWDNKLWFMGGAMLFGGFCFPLYSLCLAHTNDHLQPNQMVAASSGLLLVNGVGAIAGPIGVSLLMGAVGSWMFFVFMGGACSIIVIFAIYRMSVKEAVPLDDQNDFVAMPVRSGMVAVTLNPESEEWDEEEPDETSPPKMSKASIGIMADREDEDEEEEDEEQSPLNDGPTPWNRNG